jgi:hypothetical protein
MSEHLTVQREGFVQDLLKGVTQRTAYKNNYSYKNKTDKSVDEAASRIFNDSKVHARYTELREAAVKIAEQEGLLSATQILQKLNDLILRNENEDDKTALKGLEVYGKYHKMWTDKIESNNLNKDVVIEVDTVEEADRIIAEFEKKTTK